MRVVSLLCKKGGFKGFSKRKVKNRKNNILKMGHGLVKLRLRFEIGTS